MIKTTLLSLSTLLLFAACGGDGGSDKPAAGGGGDTGGGAAAGEHMDGGDHGSATVTETLTVDGKKIVVHQFEKVEAGKDVPVSCEFSSAEERTLTVRAWIGTEDGKGSRKERLAREGDKDLHGHVQIPDPIPDGSKLWLSFEGDGEPVTHGFAYH